MNKNKQQFATKKKSTALKSKKKTEKIIKKEQTQTIINNNIINDNFQELEEMKQLFEEVEKQQNGEENLSNEMLSQLEIQEGGESDFSEDFEMVVQEQGKLNQQSKDEKKQKKISKKKIKNKQIDSLVQSHSSIQSEQIFDKETQKYLYRSQLQDVEQGKNKQQNLFNLQQFVMSAQQILTNDVIQKFLQLITVYKSRFTSHSFKSHQSTYETHFINSVKKLFENNEADNLYPLFMKCNFLDINSSLFANSVSDYETNLEMKQKNRLFSEYIQNNKPQQQFTLNDANKFNDTTQKGNDKVQENNNNPFGRIVKNEFGPEYLQRRIIEEKENEIQKIMKNIEKSNTEEQYEFFDEESYEGNLKQLSTDNQNSTKQQYPLKTQSSTKIEKLSSEQIEEIVNDVQDQSIAYLQTSNQQQSQDIIIKGILQSTAYDSFVQQNQNHQLEKLGSPLNKEDNSIMQQSQDQKGDINQQNAYDNKRLEEVLFNLEKERTDMITKKINKLHNQKLAHYQSSVQGRDEILILQQKNYDQKEKQKSNWVYLFNLPYDLSEFSEANKEIKMCIETIFGPISQVKLFNYKDFYETQVESDIQVSMQPVEVPDSLEKAFSPFSDKKKKKSKKDKKKKGFSYYSDQENTKQPAQEQNEVQNQLNQFLKKERTTLGILTKIQRKKQERLNRSYAFIQFDTYQQKLKCLTPDIRLFGVRIGSYMCNIDEADYKLSIIIQNIPWGSTIGKLCNFLNEQFKKNNQIDIQIQIDPEEKKKIITKHFMLLRLNSLQDSIAALEIINELIYEKRKLHAHHCFGSLKQFNGNYYESLDQDNRESIQKILLEKRNLELMRIISEEQISGSTETILFEDDTQIAIPEDNIKVFEDEKELYSDDSQEETNNQVEQVQQQITAIEKYEIDCREIERKNLPLFQKDK